ncbi:hypothetical protein [Natrarchaeobius oligotrophus]|uniref:Phage major capsid protein n=1 Tax=Natrarchaeobius chitinivorans TaxID=1679083 RepID=A0A3N6LXL3_NATCH|nr:hypothetical protein [Natrarchaeobius chitinivorans]RQG93737.1 hypothetical protein EA472_22650 [Natrarchaeobius chitinivorans]
MRPNELLSYGGNSPEAFVESHLVGNVPLDWDDGLLQRAQYDTSVDGHVNSIFTATLYAQYNSEHEWYSALQQVDRFNASLEGPVTAKAYRAATDAVDLQTHPEGGDVPEGETFGVEPVEFDPKRSETVIEVSDLQEIRSTIEDAVGFEEFWELQQEQLDLAIDRDGISEAVFQGDDQYDDEDKITTLDRVIASSDEEDEATDPNGDPYDAGDLDYGSITRAEDDWADSFVEYHVTEDEQLTEDLVNRFLNNFNEFADVDVYSDTAILTGHDTARVLSDLAADRNNVRNQAAMAEYVRENVGDGQTIRGLSGTARYRDYDGIPIVANQHAIKHGDLSSIFVVPTDTIRGQPRLAIEQFAEPYVETAGRGQTQGYLATGRYREEALMMMHHEAVNRDFSSGALLRDITE